MENTSISTNLAGAIGWRRRVLDIIAAAIAGLMLAAAFPPLEIEWLAWLWPLPFMLRSFSRMKRWRLVNGLVFGLAFFIPNLWWLNTIGFGAGIMLGAICAIFPAIWYTLLATATDLSTPRPRQRMQTTTKAELESVPTRLVPGRFVMLTLFAASSWVTLEWLRSWLFTGFPWNHLGTSQWQNPTMLALLPWTGVYGPGFIMIVISCTLAWLLAGWWRYFRDKKQRPSSLPVILAVVVILPAAIALLRSPQNKQQPQETLRVAAVQGNIPQIRFYTDEQFQESMEVYETLTLQAVRACPELDLVVWPESAIPAPLACSAEYYEMMKRLLTTTRIPMLIGSLHVQQLDENPENRIETNSALLLNEKTELVDFYSKTHLVPFGEYVPFANALPVLRKMVGMGRDITPGREFTVFKLAKNARAGVNICYEDAFPDISRNFVLRGANLLATLTNDAWYATSAGPKQHLIHAVLRAVENNRPLLRSGNNSDTCLILANGRVVNPVIDQETGNRFVRGWRIYEIPIQSNPKLTFYTRHGNVFAYCCAGFTFIAGIAGTCMIMRKKIRLHQLIQKDNV